MASTSPLYSIIIRSFNEERHIGKLMDGIRQQGFYDKCEVILVDSGSTDNTVKIARDKDAKIVNIRPEEFSFGRALNIGCAAASGEILLFASAHVYPVYTDWLEKMVKPFESRNVGLVYGRQIGNEITKYSEHQLFRKWFPEQSDYNQLHPFCNNANAAVRKGLWLEQPYDEVLTGLEDLDWGLKIQKKGFTIVYEALAPIVHVHEESIYKIKNRYMREAIALKRILPKQNMSFAGFLRLSIGNIFTDCFHAIHDGVFFKHFKEILQFRYFQFWGTYKGLKRSGEIDSHLRNRFYYPNELKKADNNSVERQDSKKVNYDTSHAIL